MPLDFITVRQLIECFHALANIPLFFFHSFFSKEFYWHQTDKVRMFFVKFAESRGFSPLDPEAWYRQTKQSIYDTKVYEELHGEGD